jgi:hypothetical protein
VCTLSTMAETQTRLLPLFWPVCIKTPHGPWCYGSWCAEEPSHPRQVRVPCAYEVLSHRRVLQGSNVFRMQRDDTFQRLMLCCIQQLMVQDTDGDATC